MEKTLLFKFFQGEIDLMFLGASALVLTCYLTFKIIPGLITFTIERNLLDLPNFRSSHKVSTPTLGGVAFYFSLALGLFLFYPVDNDQKVYFLFPALTILFFIGLKDDLFVLSPKAKIIGQILAISLVVISFDFSGLSIYGLLGISELPIVISIPIIYFLFLAIINAINLIDGIDGLAGIIGILVLSIFAFFFYRIGLEFNFVLSLLLIGSLISFLYFNFSSGKKIFMGDTGSMLIGFVVAFQSIQFLNLTAEQFVILNISPINAAYCLISILFLPLFDMLRVFSLRLLNGANPFLPDRNHMHHILIDRGIPHFKVTIILSSISLLVFILVYSINMVSPLTMFYLFSLISLTIGFVFILLGKNTNFKFKIQFISFSKNTLRHIYSQLKYGTSLVLRTFF